MKTPCDYGECPYDAYDSEACRVYCGLGVDVTCDENEFEELLEGELKYDRYIPSSTYRDYGPSNPWDAPGMSVKDFI